MKHDFFKGLTGEIITPGDPEYNEDRQIFNRRIQKYPLAIVYCENDRDVVNAVLWCRKNCVRLRIRGGGHNYEGYCIGNDLLVIDLSRRNYMEIDEENSLLFLESGVDVREFYDFVSSRGYPFPGGSCPTVGIAAYTMGGGWGYSARHFGLGCDSLKSITMVNDRGKIITADRMQNSDLFWACLGGGSGNFGVVLSMVFELPPKVDRVTYIEIRYENTDSEKQAEFMQAWQDWLVGLDDRMTLTATFYNSLEEGRRIFSRGLFYGEPEEAEELLQPLFTLGGGSLELEYIPFLTAMIKIGSVYPTSEKFKTTGRFAYEHYDQTTTNRLAGLLENPPEGSVVVGLTFYAMGGKIAEVGSCDTAFYYRNARYIIGLLTVWEEREYERDNIEWMEDRFRYLERITRGSYVNFPYSELKDYMEDYYGGNSKKLMKVKSRYDSLNIFRFQQSIPPYRS